MKLFLNKGSRCKRWVLFYLSIGLFLPACQRKTEVYLETYVAETQAEVTEATQEVSITEPNSMLLYVYVCGAVCSPGVYALPEGSRICDAIEIAGGFCENADSMSVNQAALLSDGQMLRIYTYEEIATELETAEADDRLNINTATKSQLMTLPGIGSAKADAILAYRTEQGAFLNIEDLMKIAGIKEGIFEQIKEHIRID